MVMMTKFRPIAPKPAASASGSGDSTADNKSFSPQGKRKYVKVKSFNKSSKKRKVVKSQERASCGAERVVTLPLMPETPDRKENNNQTVHDSRVSSSPMLLSFRNNSHETSRESRTYLSHEIYGSATCHSYKPQTVSYMTVEQVTKAKVDNGLVGWKDMENDTCPRFVTDNGHVLRNKQQASAMENFFIRIGVNIMVDFVLVRCLSSTFVCSSERIVNQAKSKPLSIYGYGFENPKNIK
ncbi:hypothetical protein CTI12_AA086320 [Artemisia annua]|uniref:Uncharacterized protein n=1 Tax=Artemisia annua TaxID=35608 RepID=A0A2U1P4T7_ARTAN|nr:hypothetical protein CTI12_AA086320 [Artemisia annua]